MPRFSAELSVTSLDHLIKELQDYQEKIVNVPAKIVQDLTVSAEDYIRQNLQEISNRDGNLQASVGSSVESKLGIAYLNGAQAQYLEFGTGVVGKRLPHPLSKEVGWEYGSGPRVFTTKDGRIGWAYEDSETGKWKFTEGIAPQMPVYMAAQALRDEIVEIAKEALK